MTDYEPGTVAVATVRGVPNVRVMKSHRPVAPVHDWFSEQAIDARCGHPSSEVTDVRPLVVLDLHIARMQEFAVWLRRQSHADDSVVAQVAAQIEEQTRPPKPPEPTGLGAVVEDSSQVEYVHLGSGLWAYGTTDGPSAGRTYHSIDAVRVLSEGVTP